MLRVAPWLAAAGTRRHFRTILDSAPPDSYDSILIVKGENTPPWFLREFHERHPRARRQLYLFDSVANSPLCQRLFPLVDRVFSFDRSDVDRFGEMTYKPLFYDREFERGADGIRDIDVSFVGTLHSDRYAYCRRIVGSLPPSTRVHLHFFSQAAWFYRLQRVLDRRFREVRSGDVRFRKLDRGQVADLFSRSKVVIDSPRDGQIGLTMRTFEALAAGARLVTTNEAVMHESFYDDRRILVVDRDAAAIDQDAVAAWYASAPPSAYAEGFEQHSIDAWAREFIDDAHAHRDA